MLAISSLSEFCREQGSSEGVKPERDYSGGLRDPRGIEEGLNGELEGMRVVRSKMQWGRGVPGSSRIPHPV